MKIVLREQVDDYEGDTTHWLLIDGKLNKCIRSLSECPEDARIGRDLMGGGEIIDYIRMGYDAAKRGEPLDVEVVRGGDPDDD